jgi:long-chain fatty acid transport protein
MKKLAVVVALLAATPAMATNGIRMTGFGPVQNSMGGASAAAALDAATVVTNPAGMFELGGRFDFGATYFGATVKYNATEVPLPGPPLSPPPGFAVQNNGTSYTSDRGPTPVPAFGLVIPLSKDVRFGLGAYGIAGLGVDYKENLFGSVVHSAYSQMRFAPGISWKLSDMFSLGVTANVMYSQLGYSLAAKSVGDGGAGQQPHNESGAFGASATLGVRFTPLEMLSIGLAWETPSAFQKFSFDVQAQQAFNLATGAVVTVPGGKDELDFKPPQSLLGGIAVRPMNGLLVAADVQWLNWSAVLGDNKPAYSVNGSGAIPFDLTWKDQVVFKLGVQWDAMEQLKVRAGWNYGKSPLDASKAVQNIAFPAIAENHFMLGVGIKLGDAVVLNVGGMYAPEVKLTGSAPTTLIASYETTMDQYGVDVGLAYTF